MEDLIDSFDRFVNNITLLIASLITFFGVSIYYRLKQRRREDERKKQRELEIKIEKERKLEMERLKMLSVEKEKTILSLLEKGFELDNSLFEHIELPNELKTPLQQYIVFFKEYVRISKGQEIDFEVKQDEKGLKIVTNENDEQSLNDINRWFQEYVSFVKKNINDIIINIEAENIDTKEIDFLRLKLESQLIKLEQDLKIANLENKMLQKSNEFLKKISLNFSKHQTTIQNLSIKDGHQQFADRIENKK